MQLSTDDLIKIIVAIIASIGGVGAIFAGIIYWFGKLLSDQIAQRTTAKYDKEIEEIRAEHNTDLEHLRAELAERRDMFVAAQSALSSGYTESHGRVLEALELFWNRIMGIREWATPVIQSYIVPEFNEWAKTHAAEPLQMAKISENYYVDGYNELYKGMDSKRPFLGERLWELYTRLYRK